MEYRRIDSVVTDINVVVSENDVVVLKIGGGIAEIDVVVS